MGDELRVDPETLHASASQIDISADDCGHSMARRMVESLQLKPVGSGSVRQR